MPSTPDIHERSSFMWLAYVSRMLRKLTHSYFLMVLMIKVPSSDRQNDCPDLESANTPYSNTVKGS